MYTGPRKRRRIVLPVILLLVLVAIAVLLVMILTRFFGELEEDDQPVYLHEPL